MSRSGQPPDLKKIHGQEASKVSKMKGSLAEELYSESLKLSRMELNSTSCEQNKEVEDSQDPDRVDSLLNDDDFLWDSDHEVEKSSDLDREWQRRRDQFYTAGYRDGLIAGKEAAAQEGFNIGFKQSVSDGYKWGLVRGVTSALALLPDGLKEKLIESDEKRAEFQKLYETAHSLSTIDALRLFNDAIVAKKVTEQGIGRNAEVTSSCEGDISEGKSNQNRLELYYEELQSLLLVSPEIKVKIP